MHSSFASKHFIAGKGGIDAVARLESYTNKCSSRYAKFAQDIVQISAAVVKIRESSRVRGAPDDPDSPGEVKGARRNKVSAVFSSFASGTADDFEQSTAWYARDAVGALHYFGASVPHIIAKVDKASAQRDKLYVTSALDRERRLLQPVPSAF